MKSIDLFAGIGGIRLGFERASGDNLETVFVSEIDEDARKIYKANFRNSEISGDITAIDEKDIPAFDICLAGFPCQAFSLAGKKEGFNDKTRGTLFFDIARICNYHKPKVIFLENVKNLTSHDKGNTFKVIISTLQEIGYTPFWQVLNSADFGVPQNRERVYIVAFRADIAPALFDFPAPTNPNAKLKDILEHNVSGNFFMGNRYLKTLRERTNRNHAKGNRYGLVLRDLEGVAGALMVGGMGIERNLIQDLTPTDFTGCRKVIDGYNSEGIRRLTPREWARLQGFPESFVIAKAETTAYKQFGNTVTVPVIEAIARKILAVL